LQKKVAEALQILKALGLPVESWTEKRAHRIALALLAVADIKSDSEWKDARVLDLSNPRTITSREIITYWTKHFGENVSSGSYDDVRRRDLVHLVLSDIVLPSAKNPDANRNDPTRGYAINPDAAKVLRKFGQRSWNAAVYAFYARHGSLEDRLERRRNIKTVPIKLPSGLSLELTLGPHNDLQKAIVERFLPQFASPKTQILYIGDTSKKDLFKDEKKLTDIGFFELAHAALPDVVAYDPDRNWVFLIEAVHSSNPISKERHLMLETMTKQCTAPRIYVSVFKDRRELRKWLLAISWETEVWLVESPDHLIHFDGEKFLGPYQE